MVTVTNLAKTHSPKTAADDVRFAPATDS